MADYDDHLFFPRLQKNVAPFSSIKDDWIDIDRSYGIIYFAAIEHKMGKFRPPPDHYQIVHFLCRL